MTKQSYLKRLSFLLYVCLPHQEAQDITQDYRQMLAHTDNINAFDTPYQAVKPLLPPIHKNKHLLLFLGCVLFVLIALGGVFVPHTVPFGVQAVCGVLFAVVLYLTLGKTHTKPSKAIVLTFVILTLCNGICFFLGYQMYLHLPASMIGIAIQRFLLFYSVCCAVLAIITLILAKASQKPWHSITILAMGMLYGCMFFLSCITKQDLITTPFATMLQQTAMVVGGGYLMAVIGLC